MRLLKYCLISALALGFAPAQAGAQISAKPQCAPSAERLQKLQAAQTGVFQFLRLAETPLYLGDLSFQTETGKTVKLADFAGKTLLVNLWGVWCPPCRREMPALAELQKTRGGADFAVLTIHDERSNAEKVRAFMQDAGRAGAENLPLYKDGNMAFYDALRQEGLARGLPVSLLVDAKSCLIASLNGGVSWAEPEAWTFIQAAMKD